MLNTFLNFIRNIKITPWQWIFGFVGILMVRFLLENISSQNNLGLITSDLSTLLHYLLFYLGLLLSLVICLKIFIKIEIGDLTKMALFILPITWLAPIIDLIITGGSGWNMTYNFHAWPRLVIDFFTFFGNFNSGITMGIRIEIFIILVGVLLLVYKNTKNIFKTILAILLCYLMFFLWSIMPNLLPIVNDLFTTDFTTAAANNSIISKNIIQPGLEFSDVIRNKEILFNYLMIQTYLIINSIILFIWSIIYNQKLIINILKHSRSQRFLFYFSFFIIGLVVSLKNYSGGIDWYWFNCLTLINISLAYFYVWLFAIAENDIIDKPIDQISNQNRPLVKNIINQDQLKKCSVIFLLLSIIGSFAAGIYALFFMLIFIAIAYIYSSPPLRLKKVPIISTFLISIVTLSMAMSGFFLISPDKTISAFPLNITLLIIVVVTVAANIKDLKDYQGDQANNIKTVVTFFGLTKAKKIISLISSATFILIPIILKNYLMLTPSIIFASLAYYLINKKDFNDKYIFILYFILITIILIQY